MKAFVKKKSDIDSDYNFFLRSKDDKKNNLFIHKCTNDLQPLRSSGNTKSQAPNHKQYSMTKIIIFKF